MAVITIAARPARADLAAARPRAAPGPARVHLSWLWRGAAQQAFQRKQSRGPGQGCRCRQTTPLHRVSSAWRGSRVRRDRFDIGRTLARWHRRCDCWRRRRRRRRRRGGDHGRGGQGGGRAARAPGAAPIRTRNPIPTNPKPLTATLNQPNLAPTPHPTPHPNPHPKQPSPQPLAPSRCGSTACACSV